MQIHTEDKALVDRLRKAMPYIPNDSAFANSICAAQEQYGSLSEGRRTWANKLLDRARRAYKAAQAPNAGDATVGSCAGILALFDRVKDKHVKRQPAIELMVGEFPPDDGVRISVAGSSAKHPGSLTLLSVFKVPVAGKEFPQREWMGRILKDGTVQLADRVHDRPAGYAAALLDKLAKFAADPSKIAIADGKLAGRCCFCRGAISTPKSTFVGYGKKCAANWGLPWGDTGEVFEAAPAAKPAVDLIAMATQMQGNNGATDGTDDYEALARREARTGRAA